MNIENLKKAQEYIKTIPEEYFNMEVYRHDISDDRDGNVNKLSDITGCGTVGCVIGWCTALDTPEGIEPFRYGMFGKIHFSDWGETFFGIEYDTDLWYYLFGANWAQHDITNTTAHAVYRIQKILDGYEPENICKEFVKETSYIKGSEQVKNLIEDIKKDGLNATMKKFKVTAFDIETDGIFAVFFDNGLKLIIVGDIYDYERLTLSYELQNCAGDSIISYMRSDANVTSWYDIKIREQTKPGYFKN